uniref:LysM domain-containing protein n=1 Tax=Pavo cristatus TaxID=9049 RepID=A0A8C9G0W3_PAVCR
RELQLFLQAGNQDTINSIALKFNITPNKLVELNKLFTHTIVPGQSKSLFLHHRHKRSEVS